MHTFQYQDLSVHISEHARTRMAQRAVPVHVVDALLAIGKRDHDHRGGVRIHVHQKAAKRRFSAALGAAAGSQYQNVYAVLVGDSETSSSTLVTVGRIHAGARFR